ncbi:MAG: hypothetical protein PUJ55_10860 [Clostridiales bacterium]|nr:hypothetical protein [Roseburia sp.]MDD7637421.1 hypothetical protein [Clostridiales bacterium]MDY4111979.1 hypothetical protein [Roseburia sp.]
MFDKFGEFDSAEEMNRAAAAQMAEGDTEAIMAIAQENGIDKEDAEDYIDGCVETLTTPLLAAMGKLKVESEDLQLGGITEDWKNCIMEMCAEDEALCAAVRRKGKELKHCMASLIKFSFENKVQISDKILDVTQVMHNGKLEKVHKPLYLGVPSNADAKRIIREYYLGEK